jgi:heat shock protein HslJ
VKALRPVVGALLVTACSSDGADDDVTALLEDRTWRLERYVDAGATVTVSPGLRPASLVFEAGVAAVDTSCNTGSVDYDTAGDAVTFESLVITEIACGPETSGVEQAVVDMLQGETAIGVSGDELVIDRGEDRLVYLAD